MSLNKTVSVQQRRIQFFFNKIKNMYRQRNDTEVFKDHSVRKKKRDINTAFSTAPLLFTLFAVQNFHSLSRITQNLLDSSLP